MRKKEIGGLATVIMHERDHVVLLEPREKRHARHHPAFAGGSARRQGCFPRTKSQVGGEMLDVAEMLIDKNGWANSGLPNFKDHYEAALKTLLKAKKAGREIKEFEPPEVPPSPAACWRPCAKV